MSKQISAVEWYENRIFILQIQLEKKEISLGEYSVTRVELFKQAKEMEKEQIIDIIKLVIEKEYHEQTWSKCGSISYVAEQYYNQTFKSE